MGGGASFFTNLVGEYISNPTKNQWLDKLISTGKAVESVVNFIPDAVGPLGSARLSDVIDLDKKLAPYFSELQGKKSKSLIVSPEEFGAVLKHAIVEEGRKAGSSPLVGNPVRDKFKEIYGTDEDGFVQRAIDNYNKSNQPAL